MTAKRKATSASIITIGTEVCDGEVLNSNAQWIAQQLTELHLNVTRHLSVPDTADLIADALELAKNDCTLLVVTGGLGPTKDDFTRDVIAQWAKRSLVYDDTSWQRIVKRLTDMNVVVAESNKRQCYFPKDATIITNPGGTANAFAMTLSRDTTLLCLPGPPAEIKAIWNAGAKDYLQALAPKEDRLTLWHWHCLGISESQLGEIVEDALQGSGYTTGYRPVIPYVDVKVWVPEGRSVQNDGYLQALDAAIAKWTVARDDEDVASTFLNKIAGHSLNILDEVTNGALAARLGQAVAKVRVTNTPLPKLSVTTTISGTASIEPFENFHISLQASDRNSVCTLRTDLNDTVSTCEITYPRKVTADSYDRYARFVTEMLFVELNRVLT